MTNTAATPCPPTSRHLTLANGLAVTLIHFPAATQTGAAIRVAIGSHDEPARYPGTAHFLEHLFFLGGYAFTGEQRLMPFVQRHSGRVNASTRERDTYFFFELPPDVAEQGVARLCDMLFHPRFDAASQHREREILHSEFQLWQRDTEVRCTEALAKALPAKHPLLEFHAGNRDSLPIEQPEFQQALKDFHQTFYRAGQMRLVLTGPQSLDSLQLIAETYGQHFPASAHFQQPEPPSLLPIASQSLQLYVDGGLPRLSFFFPLEKLLPGSINAINFLSVWLEHESHNCLLDQLRHQNMVESLRVRVPYHYAGQALLAIDFFLSEDISQPTEVIAQLFFDWLNFFTTQPPWLTLQDEYHRLLCRRMICMSPLELARYWAERLSPRDDTDITSAERLSATDMSALHRILAQLSTQRVIQILARPDTDQEACQADNDVTSNAPHFAAKHPPSIPWQLPQPNPFLRSSSSTRPLQTPHIASGGFNFSSVLPRSGYQAAVFLRWHHATSHPDQKRIYHVLSAALLPITSLARQAGTEVSFENQGNQWLLTLTGLAEPLPGIFKAVLNVMATPPSTSWVQGLHHQHNEQQRISGELLIRQLLHRLPSVINGTASEPDDTAVTGDITKQEPQALAEILQSAHWTGLALGLPLSLESALKACLPSIAGQPVVSPIPSRLASKHGYLWCDAAIPSPECAVLLFCPLPVHDAPTEARWRLLAQCYQNAFYQRLRTELQLGYAVFCGFRQTGAQSGILFAVQSPHASGAEILAHIEAFLVAQRHVLACLDNEEVHQRATALGHLLGDPSVGFRAAADQLWQAHTNAQSNDLSAYLKNMRHTLHTTDSTHVLASHDALQQAQGNWICLANAPPPDERWH